MALTKSEVEKYISKIEGRLSPHERNLKGLIFADLFKKAGELKTAKRYTLAYMSANSNDYRAHKFLGELFEEGQDYQRALESYKRSFAINNSQNDVLLKIVKLYTELKIDPEIAKAWADHASKRIPGHPAIFDLQVHLLELKRPSNFDELIDLIAGELTQRPHDISVHTRLVETYIKMDHLDDAYEHCVSVNKTKAFHKNLPWFVQTVGVLEKYLEFIEAQVVNHSPMSRQSILQEIYMALLTSYCNLIELNLSQSTLRRSSRSLLRLDQLLYQAINLDNGFSNSTDLSEANEWDVAITEIRAQLYMLSGNLLLRLAKEGYSTWSQSLEMATACYVTSYRVPEPEMTSSWVAKSSSERNPIMWSILASSRLSVTGHLILATLNRYGEEKINNILLNLCSPQGQEDIISTLYGHDNDFSKLFLSEDESFLTPEFIIPGQLIKYDEVLINKNPLNLDLIIWIGLQWYQHGQETEAGIEILVSQLFEGLRMDVHDVSQCAADFVCLRDIEAFIYAVIKCSAHEIFEDLDVVYEYYQPKLLPLCLCDSLSIPTQKDWWSSVYALFRGTQSVSGSGKAKMKVQQGLEQIRVIKNEGMHPKLVTHLATSFGQKSLLLKDAAGYSQWFYSVHWKSFQFRSLHYWNVALSLFEDMKRNKNPGCPKDPLFPHNLSYFEHHDIHRYFREACMTLGEAAVERGDFEHALNLFSRVESSHAAWNEAQIFKHLAGLESSNAGVDDRAYDSYINYLSDTKDKLMLCLERLEYDKVVREAVEEELAAVESLMNERKSYYHVDPRKSIDFHQLDFDALKSPVCSDITESGETMALKENDTKELLATVSEVTLDNGFLREQVSIRDEQVLRLSRQVQDLQSELARYKQNGDFSPAFSFPSERSSPLDNSESTTVHLETGEKFTRQGIFANNIVVPTDRYDDPSFFSGLSKSNTPDRTQGGPDDLDGEETEDSEDEEDGEGDNIFFEPIVQLTTPVEFRSGEEDETVIFEERSKLFRFQNGEWKERGLGNLKLLWNKTSGQARIVMRREKVLKICANHFLTPDMKLRAGIGSEKSWIWSTLADISDDETKPEQFAAKFQTKDIAENFKTKFEELQKRKASYEPELPAVSPFAANPLATKPSPDRINLPVLSSNVPYLSSTPSKSNAELKLTKPGEPNLADGRSNGSTIETPFTLSIPVGLNQKNDGVSNALNFWNQPQMFHGSLNMPFFQSNKPSDSKQEPQPSPHLDPEQTSSSAPPQNSLTSALHPQNTFSFTFAKNPDVQTVSDKNERISSIPSGTSNEEEGSENPKNTSIFGDASKVGGLSFQDLASQSGDGESFSSHGTGGAGFTGFGKLIFSVPDNEREEHDIENEANIDFKPIVSLSLVKNQATGEEGEMVKFCERAKLFRFDVASKEWKERGVGEMKLLYDPSSGKSRVVMRRDQVRKLCANHLILQSTKLKANTTSNRSWLWYTPADMSDGKPKAEQLAVRFQQEETASEFKTIFEELQSISPTSKACDPDADQDTSTNVAATSQLNSDLKLQFQPPAGSWACDTCMVQNPEKNTHCIACQATKPGLSKQQPSNQFAFAPTGFSFGSLETKDDVSQSDIVKSDPNSGFSFGSPSFSFGSQAREDKIAQSDSRKFCPNSGFNFNAPTSSSNVSKDVTFDPAIRSKDAESSKLEKGKQTFDEDYFDSEDTDSDSDSSEESSFLKLPTRNNTNDLSEKDLRLIFKHSEGSWECETCLIRNGANVVECAACKTPKHSHGVSSETPQILGENVGLDNSGVAFWPGKSSSTELTGFNFLVRDNLLTNQGFSFGMPYSSTFDSTASALPAQDKTEQSCYTNVHPQYASEDQKHKFEASEGGTKPADTFIFGQSSSEQEKSSSSYQLAGNTNKSTSKQENIGLGSSQNDSFTFGKSSGGEFSLGKTPSDGFTFGDGQNQPSGFNFNQPTSKSSSENKGYGFGTSETREPTISFGGVDNQDIVKQFSFVSPATNDQPNNDKAGSLQLESEKPMNKSISTMKEEVKNSTEPLSRGVFTFRLDIPEEPTLTSPKNKDLNVSEDNPEDEDKSVVFKPIVSLPSPTKQTTGEEHETTLFCSHAKLFRFSESSWKERGVGEIKVLFDSSRQRGRIIMRRDQVHIVCANHIISKDMELKPMGSSDKSWVWHVQGDFADNETKEQLFAVKFRDVDTALAFKYAFEKCLDAKMNLLDGVSGKSEAVVVNEISATEEQRVRAEMFLLPANFYVYENQNKLAYEDREVEEDALKTLSTAQASVTPESNQQSFIFGSTDITSLSFSALASGIGGTSAFGKSFPNKEFAGAGSKLFNQKNSEDLRDDDPESEVSGVDFKAIVQLEKIEQSSGEENEDVIYSQRAKLYRYDKDTAQWKERGVGNLKLLKHKITGQVRVLMRRDQILKICANHFLTADMELKANAGSDRSWVWHTSGDIADGDPKVEQLAVKFKNAEIAQEFKEKFNLCKEELVNDPDGNKVNVDEEVDPLILKQTEKHGLDVDLMFRTKALDKTAETVHASKTEIDLGNSEKQIKSDDATSPKETTVLLADDRIFSEFKDTEEQNLSTNHEKKHLPAKLSLPLNDPGKTPSKYASPEQSKGYSSNQIKTRTSSSSTKSPPREILTSIDQASLSSEPVSTVNFNLHSIVASKAIFTGLEEEVTFQTTNNDAGKTDVVKELFPDLETNGSEKDGEKDEQIDSDVKSNSLPKSGKSVFKFGSNEISTLSFASLAGQSRGFTDKPGDKKAFLGSGEKLFSSNDENDPEREVEGSDFKPVVSLPHVVEQRTGEENESVVYSHRAKLYRYDMIAKQWKERGVGDIKILLHHDTKRSRVVMRRDQIHKLCANHYISPGMELKENEGSDRSWVWSVDADFADGVAKNELLAIRFKHREDAVMFRDKFIECRDGEKNEIEVNKLSSLEEKSRNEDDDVDIIFEKLPSKEQQERAELYQLPKTFYFFQDDLNDEVEKTCDGDYEVNDVQSGEDDVVIIFEKIASTEQKERAQLYQLPQTFHFAKETDDDSFVEFDSKSSQAINKKVENVSEISNVSKEDNKNDGEESVITSPGIYFEDEKYRYKFSVVDESPMKAKEDSSTTTTYAHSFVFGSPDTSLIEAAGKTSGFSSTLNEKQSLSHPQTASQDLKEMFKAPEGSWDCDICLISNPKESETCLACQTPKPGQTTSSTFVFGQSFSGQEEISSPFQFGGSTNKPSSEKEGSVQLDVSQSDDFTFGDTTSGGFNFGNTTSGGFNFGNTTSGGFNFGKSSGDELSFGKTPSDGFTFGDGQNQSFGFNFNQPTSKSSSENSENKEPGFGFGTSEREPTISFGGVDNQDIVKQFSFVSPATNDQPNNDKTGSLQIENEKPMNKSISTMKEEVKNSTEPLSRGVFTFRLDIPKEPTLTSPKNKDLNVSEDNPEDEDKSVVFKPIVSLPSPTKQTTGEEHETTLFCSHAKLFRFSESSWKERGVGEIKVLFDSSQQRGRIIMRRDQVHIVCANHIISKDMELKPMGSSDKSWVWHVQGDFADNETKEQLFAVKFRDVDTALAFKYAFEKCLDAKVNLLDEVSGKSEAVVVNEISATEEQRVRAEMFLLPSNFYVYENQNKLAYEDREVEEDALKTLSTAQASVTPEPNQQSFIFGSTDITSLSFSALASGIGGTFAFGKSFPNKEFAGAGSKLFNQKNSEDLRDDDPESEASGVDFKAIVQLEKIEQSSGEENEDVIYSQRAKLYRYDKDAAQWKERGVGNLKLLKHKITGQVRVLMRRDQILKICANHFLTADMELKANAGSDRSWVWYTSGDIADGDPKVEQLAVKFKNAEIAQEFKEKFDLCKEELKTCEIFDNNGKDIIEKQRLTEKDEDIHASSSLSVSLKKKDLASQVTSETSSGSLSCENLCDKGLVSRNDTEKLEKKEEAKSKGSRAENKEAIFPAKEIHHRLFPISPFYRDYLRSLSNQDIQERTLQLLFTRDAEVYFFDETEDNWCERGFGSLQIICYNNEYHIFMSDQKKTFLAHQITPAMDLKPNSGSDRSWVWFTLADHSDVVVAERKLAAEFQTVEDSFEFKKIFDGCRDASGVPHEGHVQAMAASFNSNAHKLPSHQPKSPAAAKLQPCDGSESHFHIWRICPDCKVENSLENASCLACGNIFTAKDLSVLKKIRKPQIFQPSLCKFKKVKPTPEVNVTRKLTAERAVIEWWKCMFCGVENNLENPHCVVCLGPKYSSCSPEITAILDEISKK
ncbi:E3 SUMO-protein ligase RanBP2-like isoform X2 [Dendronephthya gigantea]|uniref:E3 SUMO-protein ligase RanBP2-like isoform X2 n=1 Tax=Dendronephthya gigantea TaxID=151771 RepID=UPI00106D0D50|nr:E3 SUMO-protein ligase RanBP2-like isoform X2 [Dendronephthya gigantea]